MKSENLRVLIVSEHASTQFGGEAILPWHYFRILRRRGIETWLIVHERTRNELINLLPEEVGRIYFLPDTLFNKVTWKLGKFLPQQVAYFTFAYLRRFSNQLSARKLARNLISELSINLIHQPIPVSPREPSLMYEMGVPVVIGPMNGNMAYPPAFECKDKYKNLKLFITIARLFSDIINRLIPGKLYASVLLVANDRTRKALPMGVEGNVITLVENGVDLDLWTPVQQYQSVNKSIKFVYLGRLVDWKAVHIILFAFAKIKTPDLPCLEIIGDGPMRLQLEKLVENLDLKDRVNFAGWQPQTECARRLRTVDVLALSSLYECGGAVVLEAMACGLPVIATDWGGPADYLDESCGILIAPGCQDAMISGFAEAMTKLVHEPVLREKLGRAGREKIEREFNWENKVDKMTVVYRQAMMSSQNSKKATPGEQTLP